MVSKKKHEEHTVHTEVSGKKEDVVEIPVGKYLGGVRKNPWIAATFVLALALILVLMFGRGASTSVVSADEAGQNVMKFIQSNPDVGDAVSLVSTAQEGQFYVVTLSYQGQNVPVYSTLDGEYLIGNPVKLNEDTTDPTGGDDAAQPTQPTPSVTKSDKPKVEAFVMSHCPYGTQIEKGLIPVVQALGDKIDFEIKFVNYAMHGEKEVYEQLNQYCIQKEQNDKYLNYLTCFLEAGDSPGCLTKTGINKVKLDACTKKTDTEFEITKNFEDKASWSGGQFPKFMINDAENAQYGVRGSPTLVINGAQASSGRDSASLLRTICAAFNTAPAECSETLSSAQPSAGFGTATAASGSGTGAQCG